MSKILMRAAMSPLDNLTPFQVLVRNSIGNNIGNMLFPHSICRTLMTEGTQIDTIKTRRLLADHNAISKEAKRINEEYDCLILSFANAFRISFMDELRCITALVNKLTIPCVVVGVGIQAGINKELTSPELAKTVTDFVRAVLDKSSCIGLRGEYTASYLQGLGFQEEKDYTVIGCPSMFMWGKDLPEPDVKPLTPESSVSMNSKISLPQKFHNFMYRCQQEIPDYYYIPQVIEEIYQMYVGMPYPKNFVKKIPKRFPVDLSSPVYQEDHARVFFNVKAWLDFLKQRDFSFGSRIHGNIAGVLSGIPVYVFVSDQRILELVEYHNIPHSMISEINQDTSIFDVYEKADFRQIRKGHEERFLHYLDFLKKNNLETIYDENGVPGRVYFDEKLSEIDFRAPMRAFSVVSPKEQVKRLDRVFRRLRGDNKEESQAKAPGLDRVLKHLRSI